MAESVSNDYAGNSTIRRSSAALQAGDVLPTLTTNLTLHRLVLHATAGRDFTNFHYDDLAAQLAGARGAFINNVFALGIWERAVRDLIGPAGIFHTIEGLRMSAFNVVGDQLVTHGTVVETWQYDKVSFARIALHTTNQTLGKTTLGPGTVVVSVPAGAGAGDVQHRYAAHDAWAASNHKTSTPTPGKAEVAEPWQEVASWVGENLVSAEAITAADPVDEGVIRRMCEPLELDSPVHHDRTAARLLGYKNIVAPVCGVGTSYVDPGSWSPGQPTQYPDAARDAELPVPNGVENGGQCRTLPLPDSSVSILSEVQLKLSAPIYAGDLLSVRRVQLVAVVPKRTSIGDGAFLTFVNDVWNADHLIGRVTKVQYQYLPQP